MHPTNEKWLIDIEIFFAVLDDIQNQQALEPTCLRLYEARQEVQFKSNQSGNIRVFVVLIETSGSSVSPKRGLDVTWNCKMVV